jgi:hypothetical protein
MIDYGEGLFCSNSSKATALNCSSLLSNRRVLIASARHASIWLAP